MTSGRAPHWPLALCLLAALLQTCRTTWSAEVERVQLELEKPITPFDDLELGLADDDSSLPSRTYFDAIGWVRPLNSGLKPEVFSSFFGLHTRSQIDRQINFSGSLIKHQVHIRSENRTMLTNFEFDMDNFKAEAAAIDFNKRTIVLLPGWRTAGKCRWQNAVRDAWLELEDVNVITYHWPTGNHAIYERSVANLRLASRQIVIMFYYLTQLKQVDLRSEEFLGSVYMIGHSLGAHMAAFVSQELGSKVGRITGLDPAGPIFDNSPLSERLDKSDALLVDVYHTNSGHLKYLSVGLGLVKEFASKLLPSESMPSLNNLVKEDDYRVEVSDEARAEAAARNVVDSGRQAADVSASPSIWYGISAPIGHLDVYVNGGSLQLGCNDTMRICDHKRAIDYYLQGLKYEVQVRKDLGPKHPHLLSKRHRLSTIRGMDYSDFRSGRSLSRLCSELIGGGKLTLEQRYSALKQCTLPVDFVTPPKLLKEELARDYLLNLDRPLNDIKSFMDTTSSAPFLSETYVVKLHLERPDQNPQRQPMWQSGCKLSYYMIADQINVFSAAEYTDGHLQLLDRPDFHGLVMPIVNTYNWSLGLSALSRPEWRPELEAATNQSQLAQLLARFVPSKIVVNLDHVNQKTALKRAFDSLYNLLKQTSYRCKLNVRYVQIEPLAPAHDWHLSYWFAPLQRAPPKLVYEDELSAKLATVGEDVNINSSQDFMISLGLKYVSMARGAPSHAPAAR